MNSAASSQSKRWNHEQVLGLGRPPFRLSPRPPSRSPTGGGPVRKSRQGRMFLALGLCLQMSVFAGCQPSISADLIARVNGEEIHYEDFERFLHQQINPESDAPLALDDEIQSHLFDQFIDEKLLVMLALDSGLVTRQEQPPGEREALSFLLRGHQNQPWKVDQISAYYEAHKGQYERPAEVHLRQILVHDRAVAEEAWQVLAAGEDFAEVAARFSQGPRAHLGGDQGRLGRQDLPPALDETIFALAPGEVSEIVPADYGYHIFQVLAHYPAELVPVEEVAEEIRLELNRRQVDEMMASFSETARKRYDVQVFVLNFPFEYRGVYGDRN